MSTRKLLCAIVVTALGPASALLACSSSSSPAQAGHDSGVPLEAGPSCVAHPQTAVDILNACTDAASVDKHPVLPLLLADGGLPPLP